MSNASPRIILASNSIGRKSLMEKSGIPFESCSSGYEENMSAIHDPQALAEFLALGKAEYIAHKYPNASIIGGDTFIVVGNEKIGKPTSLKHAKMMIEKMSGKWIEVISGLAVVKTNAQGTIIHTEKTQETTRLKIKNLTPEDIQLLLNQENVLKMSGAFGIEGVGGQMIEKIEGDYDNVIGMPLKKLKKMLF